MTHFEQFDALLKESYSSAAYEDEYCLHAADLLKKFQESDWNQLELRWEQRTVEWQCRCAYAFDSPRAIPILLQMIQSSDKYLPTKACDALRTILESMKSAHLEVPPDVMQKVRHLMTQNTGLVGQSLQTLEKLLRSDD